MTGAADAAHALDGRSLGRRGRETRQRLLEATAELLHEVGLREVRVVDITRRVGTSPATFYQYFKDVEEAVLVLAEASLEDIDEIADAIDAPWDDVDAARRVVAAVMRYWDRHLDVLRVRNLKVEEGDERFRAVRLRAVEPLTRAIESKIRAGRDRGAIADDVQPYAAAASLVAMLERIGAYQRQLVRRGMTHDELVATNARIVFDTVTGRSGS